jgi:hypothetical protein
MGLSCVQSQYVQKHPPAVGLLRTTVKLVLVLAATVIGEVEA